MVLVSFGYILIHKFTFVAAVSNYKSYKNSFGQKKRREGNEDAFIAGKWGFQ